LLLQLCDRFLASRHILFQLLELHFQELPALLGFLVVDPLRSAQQDLNVGVHQVHGNAWAGRGGGDGKDILRFS